MSRLHLARLTLALLACTLLSTPLSVPAQPTADVLGPCARCHDLTNVVPEHHPPISSPELPSCLGCHKSEAGTPGAYPFAARMHRAHLREGAACTMCHVFEPNRRFALRGSARSLGTYSVEQFARLEQAMRSWATSTELAAVHGAKGDFSCGSCHRTGLPPPRNTRRIDAACVACHGSYDKLGPLAAAKLGRAEPNPHASHLGPELGCSDCHRGHAPSRAICLDCHTDFSMPMGGASIPSRR